MKLQLDEQRDTGHFLGYSALICNAVKPLMLNGRNTGATIVNRLDPESATLDGTVENGSIHFKVVKAIGADTNGCAFGPSFEVTPFGDQIAVEWKEETCSGGHVILRKMRQ